MWEDVVSVDIAHPGARGEKDFTEKHKAVSLLSECIVRIAATLGKIKTE